MQTSSISMKTNVCSQMLLKSQTYENHIGVVTLWEMWAVQCVEQWIHINSFLPSVLFVFREKHFNRWIHSGKRSPFDTKVICKQTAPWSHVTDTLDGYTLKSSVGLKRWLWRGTFNVPPRMSLISRWSRGAPFCLCVCPRPHLASWW